MIVLLSIFFFLMLAWFMDPQDSACVKNCCTPARPVVLAMVIQRLIVLIGMPLVMDMVNEMTEQFSVFKDRTNEVL